MTDFAQKRRMMVDNQLRTYDVTSRGLLTAMDETPRELFVPTADRDLAYTDRTIPLAEPGETHGRALMTAMTFARLAQAAVVKPEDKVLVVAAGTGYSAAVLSRLAGEVVALEPEPALRARAEAVLASIGAAVTVVAGDPAAGSPDHAPFDVVLIDGAFEIEPAALLSQLAEDGRLVGVRGTGRSAAVVAIRRSGDDFGEEFVTNAAAPLLESFRKPKGFIF
jgi:protein-L-isoaspartate(D-aspartate) O-methyltransferase